MIYMNNSRGDRLNTHKHSQFLGSISDEGLKWGKTLGEAELKATEV
jgi:hypothetical protein